MHLVSRNYLGKTHEDEELDICQSSIQSFIYLFIKIIFKIKSLFKTLTIHFMKNLGCGIVVDRQTSNGLTIEEYNELRSHAR